MISFAVRTVKSEEVKNQLLSTLELVTEDISVIPTNYAGITLLNLDEMAASSLKSIRNIEAILVDEATATELLQPKPTSEVPSFKSLDGVDKLEQYEHLSQLLHLQKSLRDENEIRRH
jgi:hypothetical protein